MSGEDTPDLGERRAPHSLQSLFKRHADREIEARKKFERFVLRILEELPTRMREEVERKIYELRIVRWENHQAGAPSGLPLPPPPAAPTFSQVQRTDDTTRPFMLTHNDETYVKASGVFQAAKAVWPYLATLFGAAGALYSWWVAHGGK